MGILKKPRFLIILCIVLLAAIALVMYFVFLPKPKIIGFWGMDYSSEEAVRIQELLEDDGYAIYFAENLEDVKNTDCSAWVVQATSDTYAQNILDTVGDKVIFIGSKPDLSQTVRFVGMNIEEAGSLLVELLAQIPNSGDTNEDGSVSCLLLNAPEGDRDNTYWMRGLESGLNTFHLPYTILGVHACPITAKAGMEATLDSLSSYGRDIEVILASAEVLAAGAAEAINQGGWEISEDLYLLAAGHTESSLKALTEGQRSGLVFANWEDFDALLLTAVADTIDGEAPQDYLLPFKLYQSTTPLQ